MGPRACELIAMTNTEQLRERLTKELGFTTFFGSVKPFVDLAPDEQMKVTDAVMRYIVAHRDEFTAAQVTQAQTRINSGQSGAALEDTGLLSQVSEFPGAIWDEGVKINEAVNPFSGSNRGKLLWVGIVLLVLWFGGSALFRKFTTQAPIAKAK